MRLRHRFHRRGSRNRAPTNEVEPPKPAIVCFSDDTSAISISNNDSLRNCQERRLGRRSGRRQGSPNLSKDVPTLWVPGWFKNSGFWEPFEMSSAASLKFWKYAALGAALVPSVVQAGSIPTTPPV